MAPAAPTATLASPTEEPARGRCPEVPARSLRRGAKAFAWILPFASRSPAPPTLGAAGKVQRVQRRAARDRRRHARHGRRDLQRHDRRDDLQHRSSCLRRRKRRRHLSEVARADLRTDVFRHRGFGSDRRTRGSRILGDRSDDLAVQHRRGAARERLLAGGRAERVGQLLLGAGGHRCHSGEQRRARPDRHRRRDVSRDRPHRVQEQRHVARARSEGDDHRRDQQQQPESLDLDALPRGHRQQLAAS